MDPRLHARRRPARVKISSRRAGSDLAVSSVSNIGAAPMTSSPAAPSQPRLRASWGIKQRLRFSSSRGAAGRCVEYGGAMSAGIGASEDPVSAAESQKGHFGHCYLKAQVSDAANAILTAAGYKTSGASSLGSAETMILAALASLLIAKRSRSGFLTANCFSRSICRQTLLLLTGHSGHALRLRTTPASPGSPRSTFRR